MKTDFLNLFESEYAQREFNPQETMQWLTANRTVYFSWGTSKLINLNNKGLLLKVNGHHHKGYVLITLAWNDTYTVRFFNNQYNQVKNTLTEIYCDLLQDSIDEVIEKIDDYNY
ncbi:hypothetical protein [Corallibacter sp.]|uniref:hypothetical protein n=1 Tax=Corallibacter sp. TaxID=2038084 RepID=UPI003AB44CA7